MSMYVPHVCLPGPPQQGPTTGVPLQEMSQDGSPSTVFLMNLDHKVTLFYFLPTLSLLKIKPGYREAAMVHRQKSTGFRVKRLGFPFGSCYFVSLYFPFLASFWVRDGERIPPTECVC